MGNSAIGRGHRGQDARLRWKYIYQRDWHRPSTKSKIEVHDITAEDCLEKRKQSAEYQKSEKLRYLSHWRIGRSSISDSDLHRKDRK